MRSQQEDTQWLIAVGEYRLGQPHPIRRLKDVLKITGRDDADFLNTDDEVRVQRSAIYYSRGCVKRRSALSLAAARVNIAWKPGADDLKK